MDKALDTVPKDMDATYERILSTINKKPQGQRELAIRVLVCIAYSRSPIPISLLRYAISVEGDNESLRSLESSIPTERAILGACANLIVIDQNTQLVSFVHYSVQEFFTRRSIETLDIGREFGHREIARMFITLLAILHAHSLKDCTAIEKYREHLKILNEWPHHLLAANLDSLPTDHHMITLTSTFFNKFPLVSIANAGWSSEVTTYFCFSPAVLSLIFNLPETHSNYCPQQPNRTPLEKKQLLRIHGGEQFIIIHNNNFAMHYATSVLSSIPAAQRLHSHRYPINYSHDSTNDLQSVFQYNTSSPNSTRFPGMFEYTPLFSVSDVKLAEFLLDNGASLEAQIMGGNSVDPLNFFAAKGNADVTQLLSDRVAGECGTRHSEALSAIIGDRTKADIIRLLLNDGANPHAQHEIYGNVLQAAAYFGHVEAIHLLLGKKADVNVQGGYYGNALQAAAHRGNVEVMRLLLDKGANVNAKGGHYASALEAAVDSGNVEVIRLLLDKGANLNAEGGEHGNALLTAVYLGRVEAMRLLLDNGADVNAQGGYYGTALQLAAIRDEVKAMRLLLERGADVNARGGQYGNALQAASYCGNVQAIQLLLDMKAEVNVQGGEYGNALRAAAYRGQVEAMQLLLDNGADANAQSGEHGNALQAAAYTNHAKAIRLLLDNGADIDAQGGYHGSALQAAAYNGNIEAMRLLLDEGANVNAKCGYYGNALQAAAFWGQFGQVEAMRLLLDRGADVNAQGGKYGSALQAAACRGQVNAIRLLLDKGADVNAQGGEYGNALQAASNTGQVEAMQLLRNDPSLVA